MARIRARHRHHETAFTMLPIHEKGGPKYFFSRYDKDGDRPKVAAKLGNTEKGDGIRFHGRGYVQLTGRSNYGKAKTLVGADLVGTPDLALNPAIAGKILFTGMETGLFTTKKFGDYFNKTAEDWLNARRIINGLDCAPQIADYGNASAARSATRPPEPSPYPRANFLYLMRFGMMASSPRRRFLSSS